jgi:hypothetical protein
MVCSGDTPPEKYKKERCHPPVPCCPVTLNREVQVGAWGMYQAFRNLPDLHNNIRDLAPEKKFRF